MAIEKQRCLIQFLILRTLETTPGNARVSSPGVFCDVALEIKGTFLQF